MSYFLILALGGFCAVIFLRLSRRKLYKLAEHSVSLLNVLLNSEEDDVKLQQMQRQTTKLMLSLMLGVCLIIAAVVIGYLPIYAAPYFVGESISTVYNGWLEMLAISIGASIPFFIPLPRGLSGYSELSILLHRLILNNYTIGLKLLSRELNRWQKRGLKPKSKFVIISGLARAGTTSIMNQLAELEGFCSLSYANMPFLLSPKTWARFYKPRQEKMRERSHKDGVKIGLNSAEALEEYFFKAISNDAYVHEATLEEYRLNERDYQTYLQYQTLFRKDPESIYLAKNNNFLLRYHSVRSYNPEFVMVIMFRDPLYHGASLLEKHREYKTQQREDSFILEYMNWLGHHEFGLSQKAFKFDEHDAIKGNPESLDYWLQTWINYYRKAILIQDTNTLFIHYQDFCDQPNQIVERVSKLVGKNFLPGEQSVFHNQRHVNEPHSKELLKEANNIYEGLLLRC